MILDVVFHATDAQMDVTFDGEHNFDVDFGEIHMVGSSEGTAFETDETLRMENGILSVNVSQTVAEGDYLPVSSHAVYDEFSKAVALLKTI